MGIEIHSRIPALLISAAAALWAVACGPGDKTVKEVSLESIPAGSMLVAQVESPVEAASALGESLYLDAFDSLALRRAVADGYGMLRRLCGEEAVRHPVTISASKVGAKGLCLMYVAQAGREAENSLPVFGADTTATADQYEKTDIVTVKTPSATYCYYFSGGNIVLSDNRLYIEQSILQQGGEASLGQDKSFSKTHPLLFSGKKASVALRLPAVADYAVKTLGLPDAGVLGELAPWTALELRADSTTLYAEGIFCAADSVATLVSVLTGQSVKSITLDAYFPSNTSVYTYLGISDWNKYFDDYARYLKASSQFHLYNTAAQRYNKLFGGDLRTFFLPWAGTGLAVIRTSGNGGEHLIVGVRDADAAVKALEKIADGTIPRPDPYRGYPIVPLAQKTVFYDLVTRIAPRQGSAFAAVAGDVAVFSPDVASLKKIIDDIHAGTTLTSILPYNEQKNHLATTTNLLTLVRGDLWSADLAAEATAKRRQGKALSPIEKYVRENAKQFRNLRYNFLQVSSSGSTAFINIRLSWDDSAPRQAVKEWSFSLETAPAIAPIAFPNHRNNRYDVLVQDAGGTLYLLSDKGELFWKKKLPAAISSPVVVCDLYDNRKYQMAFYTGNKFHVIDRLGRYVTDADKVARAKKMRASDPLAEVASTNEISLLKAGAMKKVKTPQSPLSSAVYIPSLDAVLYRLTDGKVYGIRPTGEKLSGYPVTAEKAFTAQDFGRDGRVGIATTSPEGTVTFYRMPKETKK